MLARRLALVCLLPVCAWAGTRGPAEDHVAVYLKTDLAPSSATLAQLKSELVATMAAAGVTLSWWNPADPAGHPGGIVVMDFKGACESPISVPAGPPLEGLASLAATEVADGRVLPFSSVDCDALARFIGAFVARLPQSRRDLAYGRALARLAAHELYHALSRQTGHAHSGIAKACFTRNDLLSDAAFEFEERVAQGKARPVAVTDDVSFDFGQ